MGRLPGGWAMSTVGACTAFGAICGSGPATASTIASVALPEIRRLIGLFERWERVAVVLGLPSRSGECRCWHFLRNPTGFATLFPVKNL
jgi:hypothetical protein